MKPIPYGHQSIDDDDILAVATALRDDWLTMGPTGRRFEEAIARVAGAADAAAVTSGTAALHTAFAAAGVGPGDEVIVPPLTFVATAATAAQLGATIRFADVSEDTGNLDPDAAAAAVTARTRVIAAVDYAGHPADLPTLQRVAHDGGALLLEDAAHSIGSALHGRPVGSLADITTFSFFPTKNLTTAEGGAVVARDREIVDRARRFRSHGLVRDPADQRYPDEGAWHQEVHGFGLNYRLPDVLSALGISQLARLGDFTRRRRTVFDRYVDGLSSIDGLTLPARRAGAEPNWHLFPIRVPSDRRRDLFDHLRANGVLVQVNYIPVYWHPVFEDLGYRRGSCPAAEDYYRQEISLPIFADLLPSDQDRVIDLVRERMGA